MTEHGSSRELLYKALKGVGLRFTRHAPGAGVDGAGRGLTGSRPLDTRVPGVGVASAGLVRLGLTGSATVRGKAYRVTGSRASAEGAGLPAAIAAIDPVHILGETSHQGNAINVDVLSALPVVARNYRNGWRDLIRYAAGCSLGTRRTPIDDGTARAVEVRPLGRGEVAEGKRDALTRYGAGHCVEVDGVHLGGSAAASI